jgi:hypothetical protein
MNKKIGLRLKQGDFTGAQGMCQEIMTKAFPPMDKLTMPPKPDKIWQN